MRILYLCHRIPYPPNKGDKIRAFQQVRAIAARHEVDLFTLADDAADMAHRSATLAEYCRQADSLPGYTPVCARLRAICHISLRGTPLTIPYFYSAELQTEVRKALRQRSYDRIFVYCSAMAQYVESVEGIPIVTDLVDVDSDKWRQYASFRQFPFSAVYRREARCLRDYERRICEQSACVFVTTEREAQLVRRDCPMSTGVRVIPMGVDTAVFKPAPASGFERSDHHLHWGHELFPQRGGGRLSLPARYSRSIRRGRCRRFAS